jgi:hypothetical protein
VTRSFFEMIVAVMAGMVIVLAIAAGGALPDRQSSTQVAARIFDVNPEAYATWCRD